MTVGEYAGDYGFSLPKSVSIHRECFRLRFETEWCMQNFIKNENTWYRVLWYYDAECLGKLELRIIPGFPFTVLYFQLQK